MPTAHVDCSRHPSSKVQPPRLTSRSLIPSPEFKDKKAVIVSVPGAFTPTCQNTHITGYLAKLGELKAKGVDVVITIAFNDPFVMAAWGKANGIKDDSIVSSLSLFVSRVFFFFSFFSLLPLILTRLLEWDTQTIPISRDKLTRNPQALRNRQ